MRRLYEDVHNGKSDGDPYDSFCKCFIKDESYPTYKVPRAIFARKDEFKIRVGPIFSAIEKEVFNLKWFVKKVPVPDRAKLLCDKFGSEPGHCDRAGEHLRRIMATDYSAYESSFIKELMLSIEFVLYDYMTQELVDHIPFMKLIRRVLTNKNVCKFRKAIVRIIACRMSGEMNTSLGNGFTNLMIFLFGMFIHDITHFDAIFEGDDCLAVYTGPKLSQSYWSKFGFTVKLEYLPSINVASFCGQVFDFDTLTVVSDPIKIILNLAWVNSKYGMARQEKLYGLLRTKALSLIYQYPGCPVIQSIGLCYVRLTEGIKAVVDEHDDAYHLYIVRAALRHDYVYVPVSMSARLVMVEKFGVSIMDQLFLERYFDTMTVIEPIWHHVLYDYIPRVCFEFNDRYVHKGGSRFVLPPSGAE